MTSGGRKGWTTNSLVAAVVVAIHSRCSTTLGLVNGDRHVPNEVLTYVFGCSEAHNRACAAGSSHVQVRIRVEVPLREVYLGSTRTFVYDKLVSCWHGCCCTLRGVVAHVWRSGDLLPLSGHGGGQSEPRPQVSCVWGLGQNCE